MNDKAIQTLIDTAKSKCDDFELAIGDSTSMSIKYDKDRLERIDQKGATSASIQAVKNGRIGFSVTTKPSEADDLIDSALRLAPYGSEYDYEFAPAAKASGTEIVDATLSDMTPKQLVELGEDAKARIKDALPDVMFGGSFATSFGESRILSSKGADAPERSSSFSFYVAAEFNQEGDFLQVYDGASSPTRIAKSEIDACADRVIGDFKAAQVSRKVSPGKHRILLTPEALSDVLTPFAVNVNGKNVEKKISRWVESRGQKVFDERITIYDDPMQAEGTGSSLYDGEGVPTQRRALIENGVLNGFIHSLSTAAHTGDTPTGNGSRSIGSIARPGFHNIVMNAGDVDLSDLMKQGDGGIIVNSFIGVFTSNFLAGQVSGSIMLGYLLEGGERVGRVKNAAVNMNTFDLFNGKIVGISKERKWMGNECLPWILVEDVAISSK